MISRRRLTATGVILGLALSGSATAQTWTPVPDAGDGVTTVSAEWPSGVIMVARCTEDRGLDVMMTLVQSVDQQNVSVTYSFDGGEQTEQRWIMSESGSLIFARQAGHFSRDLARRSQMTITVSPEQGVPQRYELETPGEVGVLRSVIQGCGLDPDPDPDDRQDSPLEYRERPGGHHLASLYPAEAMRTRTSGEATIECKVRPNGRLKDCLVLSESPQGAGFGAATLALSPYFRMDVEGRDIHDAILRIPIRWQIE